MTNIVPNWTLGPYCTETRESRLRQMDLDEWNAPIETSRGILEKAKADVAQQLRHHPKKDVDAVLGHLDDAMNDLPLMRE